ncbi:MAG: D-alanyl-D-alanine carboxypeptidase family protein, partial [Ruminococcus sp.]
SSMYLKVGEKLRLEDLCVGMLLPSGNDAATCAAVSIAGSKEKFAELMNNRAKEIGMKNTNFVTPSGLDDDNHYSTAYDMALLMRECLKNKKFCEISGSVSKTVSFVSPQDKAVTYQNHNRLLSSYEYCISGKTGYTESAGRCLVTAARKNGVTLIAVTLNDRNDWEDHTSLYEYGFTQVYSKTFSQKTITQSVVGGKSDSVKLKIEEKTFVTNSKNEKITEKILIDPFAYAPIKKGDRAGIVLYCKNGRVIDKATLTYEDDIEYKTTPSGFWEFIKGLF